jgi:hypothetical protein
MATGAQDHEFKEAKRLRAELRLALAQADELMRRAEAVLLRSRLPGDAISQDFDDKACSPALFRGGLYACCRRDHQ